MRLNVLRIFLCLCVSADEIGDMLYTYVYFFAYVRQCQLRLDFYISEEYLDTNNK